MSRVLLIDLDDTLGATQKSILKFIRKNYTKNYKFHSISHEFRDGTHKDYQEQVHDFLSRPEQVLKIEPFPKAKEALELLKNNGWDLHLVSSRKQVLHSATRNWLDMHGISEFISDYHPRPDKLGGDAFKVLSAKKIQANFAFDDTLSVAQALAEINIRTYLIQRPWNRSFLSHPLISRHRNIHQAAKKLVTANLEVNLLRQT